MQNNVGTLGTVFETDLNGTCYGTRPPSNKELADKMNEIILVINQLIDDRKVINEMIEAEQAFYNEFKDLKKRIENNVK